MNSTAKTMAETPTTTTTLPTEMLRHILSYLPLADRLQACGVNKAFAKACNGQAFATVSLSMSELRRAHAMQGRNWRPAKSLIVRWLHRHGRDISTLVVRDVIKPLSDDDAPALLLPLCCNLTHLKLQVGC